MTYIRLTAFVLGLLMTPSIKSIASLPKAYLSIDSKLSNTRFTDFIGDSSNQSEIVSQYYQQCNPLQSISCSRKGIALPDSMLLDCSPSMVGEFVYPFKGRMLSPYGNKRRHHLHSGVDIKLQAGDTVKCVFNGIVRMARRFHGYGLMVVVQHPNGLETLYAHLSKIIVSVGDKVAAGNPLGLGGRTGRATATHLHFETRFMGAHFDPAELLDYGNFSLKRDTLVVYSHNGEMIVLPEGDAAESLDTLNAMPKGLFIKEIPRKKTVYVVKKGDTLYSIARKNSIPLNDLCKINGIKLGDILSVGTKLRIR